MLFMIGTDNSNRNINIKLHLSFYALFGIKRRSDRATTSNEFEEIKERKRNGRILFLSFHWINNASMHDIKISFPKNLKTHWFSFAYSTFK